MKLRRNKRLRAMQMVHQAMLQVRRCRKMDARNGLVHAARQHNRTLVSETT
jgi:hypothetical protein